MLPKKLKNMTTETFKAITKLGVTYTHVLQSTIYIYCLKPHNNNRICKGIF